MRSFSLPCGACRRRSVFWINTTKLSPERQSLSGSHGRRPWVYHGLTGNSRQKTYIRLRKLLRRSRYDEVVSELKKRAKRKKLKVDHDVWTEIRYLEKHGSEGHLQYLTFRRRGIPCGSGVIESTIRRVINLRLKSNAMYWLEANAEAMFAIRALILCERWDDTLSCVRQTMARDRRINWQWNAPDLTKLNADETVSPPSPQTLEKQQHPSIAA